MKMNRQDEIQETIDKLGVLAPGEGEQPVPPSQALSRLKGQLTRPSQATLIPDRQKENKMSNRRRLVLAPVITVLVIAVFMAFPGVRAAASDFLGLFRVQKFAPISISVEQIAMLEELAESGLTPGQFEITEEPGPSERVDNLREAGLAAGFDVKAPTVLPAPSEIYLQSGGAARLVIDAEGAQAILRATGADPALIPDSLDGEAVNVTIYPNISQHWLEGYSMVQMESPQVVYPDVVDRVAIGTAVLQVMGLSEDEARRIASNIDWTSTLLVPVPENALQFQEVTVNGASGLALSDLQGQNTVIVWQVDGVLFGLQGSDTVRQLLRIANSVR
jgi:hypothetical protein